MNTPTSDPVDQAMDTSARAESGPRSAPPVYRLAGMGLASKLLAIGGVFLVLALASIGLTLWVTWQLEGGAAAVNEAGRMRMLSYQLALSLQHPPEDRQQLIKEVGLRKAGSRAAWRC